MVCLHAIDGTDNGHIAADIFDPAIVDSTLLVM